MAFIPISHVARPTSHENIFFIILKSDINPLANFIAHGIANLAKGSLDDYRTALRSLVETAQAFQLKRDKLVAQLVTINAGPASHHQTILRRLVIDEMANLRHDFIVRLADFVETIEQEQPPAARRLRTSTSCTPCALAVMSRHKPCLASPADKVG